MGYTADFEGPGFESTTTFHHAMAKTVSLQAVNVEGRFRSQASSYWICGRQSDIDTGFSLTSSVLPC
jgi:hypothetical protein